MKKLFGFSGVFGAILLLFGLLGRMVLLADRYYILNLHIFIGLLLVIWFFFSGKPKSGYYFDWCCFRGAFPYSSFISGLLFLVIMLCLNYIAFRQGGRWDLTIENVHSLSEKSEQLIKNLKKPVQLIALKLPQRVDLRVVNNLFRLYREGSGGKIKTRIIDPLQNPYLVDQLGLKEEHTLYIEYGEEKEKKKKTLRLERISEELIANSMIRLSEDQPRVVYYVAGHGEPDLEGQAEEGLSKFSEAISGEGFVVKRILLSRFSSVPADAALVVLASPQKELLPEEQKLLIDYVEKGGRLLLLHDPEASGDVPEIAAHFGLTVRKNAVIDPAQRFHGADLWQIIANHYTYHPITKNLNDNDLTVFLLASTVQPARRSAGGRKYTELVKTSGGAWGETDLKMLLSDQPRAALNPEDMKGPLTIAATYEEQLSRVVVFGDSEWIKNLAIDVYSNRELLLNVIHWLGQPQGGISIRPRSLRKSLQPIASKSFILARLLGLLCLELFVVFGLFICWKRRTATAN